MTVARGGNRAILRLALPALGTLAIDPILTLTDTAFVARVGVIELAALGVDTAILGFAFFGFNFLAYVTTPLVAQALGQGDRPQARRWVGDALVLAVILGLAAMVVILVLAPGLVSLMGADPEVAGPAVSYLRIRVLATPAVLIVTTGHGAFRGYQDTRTPLLVAIGVNLINLVLDPLLIFWAGLGVEGAALATLVAQYVGAVWFLRLLRSRRMADRPAGLREAVPTLLALGRSGVLVALRTGVLLLALTFAAATATRIGAAEIAAHQVVMQVWLLAAMIADSFAIAGQAMVGDAVGAGDRSGTDRLSWRLLLWGGVTGLLLLSVFFVGNPLLALLVDDPQVADLTVSAGEVAGWMMPVAAPLFVADGIFFGLLALGTVVASTSLGAVVVVLLISLTPLGDSLDGIWWAIAAMLVARGLVYLFAYRRSVEAAVRS
ncbi:MAG TPA: MATE family efflux transporter [Acidimicrobiia bacterium]|nr:MATE family efflux transporter [Acidimicrobiia bacterium]